MRNDFLDTLSDMNKTHSKYINKISRIQSKGYTACYRCNEKAKPENSISKIRRNGLKESSPDNFENCEGNLFNKIQNGLKRVSNGISKSRKTPCNSDIVIVLSEDSLSTDEFMEETKKRTEACVQYSNNSTCNGKKHINYKSFKKRKASVRIKKSKKIENLLNKNKFCLSPSNIVLNNQISKLNKTKNNRSKRKNTGSFIQRNCNQTSCDLFKNNLNILSLNKCYYLEKQKLKNEKCKESATDSSKKQNLVNVDSMDTKICVINKSLKKFPVFETIFIDAVNIDETNSEASPSLYASPNKDVKDLKLEKHRTHFKKESCTTQMNNRVSRNKNSRTRLKGNLKNLENDINMKNCKINVKNLSLEQIKQKIKESRYRPNRRRSWSVSDVAREHDRRLNFFPEAGPSHIDYYALIKLPVVKPKVPINY